jgi:hypothetical protein
MCMFVVFALLLTALLLLCLAGLKLSHASLMCERNGVVGVTVVLSNRTLHVRRFGCARSCAAVTLGHEAG